MVDHTHVRTLATGIAGIAAVIIAGVIVSAGQLQVQMATAQAPPGKEPNPITAPNPLAPRDHTGDPTHIVIGNLNFTIPQPKVNVTAPP
jgi:hypothetical protein